MTDPRRSGETTKEWIARHSQRSATTPTRPRLATAPTRVAPSTSVATQPRVSEESRNFQLLQDFQAIRQQPDVGFVVTPRTPLKDVNDALAKRLGELSKPLEPRTSIEKALALQQRAITEPGAALIVEAAARLPSPGLSQFEKNLRARQAAGNENFLDARTNAFRETDLPSTTFNVGSLLPIDPHSLGIENFSIPLGGGSSIGNIDVGVKGAAEVLADPLNVVDFGVGGLFSKGATLTARTLSKAAARETVETLAERSARIAVERARASGSAIATIPPAPGIQSRASGLQVTPRVSSDIPLVDTAGNPLVPSPRVETPSTSILSESVPPRFRQQVSGGQTSVRPGVPEIPVNPQSAITEPLSLPGRLASLSGAVPPTFRNPVQRLLGRQPLPEASVPTVPTTPAGLMAPADADSTIEWFGNLIASPESARVLELTNELRTHARGRRFEAFQSRARKLVNEGVSEEDAIKQAQGELAGELPSIQTGIESVVSADIRNALFARVYNVLSDDAPELASTTTALTNALLGKPIPRTAGIAGGSAFSRLSKIFPPGVMRALDSKQSIDQLLLSKMPKPRGVESATEFPPAGLLDAPGQPRLLEDPFVSGQIRPDTRTVAQRQIDLEEFKTSLSDEPTRLQKSAEFPEAGALDAPSQARMFDEPFESRQLPLDPRTQVERQLDLEAYKVLFAKSPVERIKNTASQPTIKDEIDKIAIKELDLLPPTAKDKMLESSKTIGVNTVDFGNLVRANVASVDLSYPRQMALLIPRQPVVFAQSFYDAVRSMFSAEYAANFMQAIRKEPLFAMYDAFQPKGGDFLRPLQGEVAAQWQAMDDFMILSRVTGETRPRPFQKIAEMTPWIRISGRAHAIGTNSMNWRIFQGYHRELLKQSEQIASGFVKQKPGEVFDIQRELLQSAKFLADMSGRGPVGPLKALTPALNAGFFSVRLNTGRLLAPRHLFSSSPFVRRKAWSNFITAITTYGGFIMAGRYMGLWDVETDRRSSDFMKILLNDGRTRVDIWGGMQQFVVLYGRLLSVFSEGETQIKSAETGQIVKADPLDIGQSFVKGKLSPAASNVLELWTGEDFKGSKIDRTDWQRWLGRNAPISGQDIYEAYEAHGLIGVPLGGLGAFGIGEQIFNLPRWPELDAYYKFSEGNTPQQTNRLRQRFRANSENEAKLFLRGQITTLSTPAAKATTLRLMRELKVSPADVPGYENVFGTRREAGVGSGR